MATKDISDVEVVRAAKDRRELSDAYFRDTYNKELDRPPFVNELLAQRTGQPLKVCDSAIARALNRRFVDCGVTERTCWPTPEGLALLESVETD